MAPLSRYASVLAVLVGGAGALGVGCSLLVDAGGLAGSADAAASPEGATTLEGGPNLDSGDKDAPGTTDATPTDAAPDADTHVGPNLLADSTFESGDGCTWRSFQGTTTTELNTARTGTKSCRVCTKETTTDYFTGGDPFTAGAPVVGTTYHAVAWVRRAPGASTPVRALLFLRTSNATPFAQVDGANTGPMALPFTDTWQRMEITMKSTMPAGQMDVFVGSDTVPGACFLLDDVWLEKLP